VLGPPFVAEYASKVNAAPEDDPVHDIASAGGVKIVPRSLLPSGLTANESIWWVEVRGKVATVATAPSTARLLTTPLESAKKTLPPATCADCGSTAQAALGIGEKVVFARARPSRPAIATVL
jgi:hypothetical protein